MIVKLKSVFSSPKTYRTGFSGPEALSAHSTHTDTSTLQTVSNILWKRPLHTDTREHACRRNIYCRSVWWSLQSDINPPTHNWRWTRFGFLLSNMLQAHSQESSGTGETGPCGPSGRLLGVDVHVWGMTKKTDSLLLLPLLRHLHRGGKIWTESINYHFCILARANKTRLNKPIKDFSASADTCKMPNIDVADTRFETA